MITMNKAKSRVNDTIGAWIYDEEDNCLFIPINDISKIIAFINNIDKVSPGYEETYSCINCSLTYTNQFVISDFSEHLILELDELTAFINDLLEMSK